MGFLETSAKVGEEPARPATPPPPYSDADQPQQQPQQPQRSQQPKPQRQVKPQFAPSFSLYSRALSTVYTIGEHKNQPAYAVGTHTGWSGKPDVVLHTGPTDSHPPLATIDSHSFSRRMDVTLPPLPGGSVAKIEMAARTGFGASVYSFTVEAGPAQRPEQFEWRHSHGNAVDSVGGSSWGWKLVRMATDAPAGTAGTFQSGRFTASDGREVLAAWAPVSFSMSKEFNFQFMGSGLAGVLGERWAVAAVITALGIWNHERKKKNSSAAAGAARV